MKSKVLEWATERNLIDVKNIYKQYAKLQEESNELYVAMLDNNRPEIVDALGDIQVVLIILASQLGLSLDACLESAYNEIKNRKGNTINGTFIKD
jgi:phosphoribosyl-ATP pyrophosphohydrolase